MKLANERNLIIPSVAVFRYQRFLDNRGYFTETYRKSDFNALSTLSSMEVSQMNESYSKKGTVRGLHFQWNPFMGKLVRTIDGDMVDLFLDIRKGSPTYGKIAGHRMVSYREDEQVEWIWLPPGFAHGNFFLEDTRIEYICTGEYNGACEAGISPLANDLDWSLCDGVLKKYFDDIIASGYIISDKDRDAMNLDQWTGDIRSDNFIYNQL